MALKSVAQGRPAGCVSWRDKGLCVVYGCICLFVVDGRQAEAHKVRLKGK